MLVGLFLTVSILFAQGNQLNMPKEFQGIYYGMSLVEFLKIRPNVRVNLVKTGSYEKADITGIVHSGCNRLRQTKRSTSTRRVR